jgi:hypothetical protein
LKRRANRIGKYAPWTSVLPVSFGLSRLRERHDDPPAVFKRDPRRIRIAQVEEPSHRVRLSYASCERGGVMGSHVLRVDLVEGIPVAHSCPQRTAADARTPFYSPARASQTLATAAPAPPSLLPSPVPLVPWREQQHQNQQRWDHYYLRRWREITLWYRVRREFFGAHEYTRETACGPLDVVVVLLPTCNGARDDEWLQGGRLIRELSALREVLLTREAVLSFAPGLYAEGSGGVEEV